MRAALALAALLAASPALAQTSPGWPYGFVPTPGQLNNEFASKQDLLNFLPCNTAGCSMTGPLLLPPSTALGANLNLGVGVAPSAPTNADLWETSTGLYGRVAGVTVWFPSVSAGTPTIAANACGSSTQGTVAAGSLDLSGSVTVGTSGVTVCTITFGNTLANAPHACALGLRNATAAAQGTTLAYVSSHTTTALVITGAALAGAQYDWLCD